MAFVAAKRQWLVMVAALALAACGGNQAGSDSATLVAPVGGDSAVTAQVKSLPERYAVLPITRSEPHARTKVLSESGQVVGTRVIDAVKRPYSWTIEGGLVDIPIPAGAEGFATSVNASGQVTGRISGTDGGAFVWSAHDGLQMIPAPDGATAMEANHINDLGLVAGSYLDADLRAQPFLWSPAEGFRTTPTPDNLGGGANWLTDDGRITGLAPGFYWPKRNVFVWGPASGPQVIGVDDVGTQASDVNRVGQIAGFTHHSLSRPFYWSQETGVVMIPVQQSNGSPAAISDAGHVVGQMDLMRRPFFWTAASGTRAIVAPGDPVGGGSVNDVNAAGHAVGHDRNGVYIWTETEGMMWLRDRLEAGSDVELLDAVRISNAGHILVTGRPTDFLLVPVGGRPPAQPPVPSTVTADDPVAVGVAVNLSATFSDPDSGETYRARWEFGDGASVDNDAVAFAEGRGEVSAVHSYAAAGVYAVKLMITDSAGKSAQVEREVVVFDRRAGFVTASGLFESPSGALAANPERAGLADFTILSRYRRGGTTPAGVVRFHLRAAGLSFRSTGLDWMVVDGARAGIAGSGTLDRRGAYRFALTLVDADVLGLRHADRYRIRLWSVVDGIEQVVYDNQIDAAGIGTVDEGSVVRGNVRIHD